METENIKRFARIFRGLDKAYGTFDITEKSASGKAKGKARIVRDPRTLATFTAHLKGQQSVGIVPINEDNNCWWGAIDVDMYPLDHTKLVAIVKELNFPLVVCRSKSGGGHIYVFLTEPVPAELVQNKLKEIAGEIGYADTTEIFPKQIQLVLERGDTGNFLNLPYFDHENGLRYAIKDGGEAATLEEFLDMAEKNAITREDLEAILTHKTEAVDEKLKDGPPCLQALIRHGFPEGTRNNGLFNIGVYLRKAFPDNWENKILEYNQAMMDPPLSLNEVNVVAEQISAPTSP